MDFIRFLLKIVGIFTKQNVQVPEITKDEPKPEVKVAAFTLEDYVTASGKYPERLKSKELTAEVKENAGVLLALVNGLLNELGVDVGTLAISSGFRPSEVNKAIPNAAKRSLHQIGLAVDIEDKDNVLGKMILDKPELLDKYGLWMESLDHTKNWLHLDKGSRSSRKIRVFIP